MSISASGATDVRRRAYWLKTLHQWHWISAALCLIGMLLFAITGITLNHASQIKSQHRVVNLKATLPETLLAPLREQAQQAPSAPLPAAVREWLGEHWSLHPGERVAEWSDDEIYLSLPRPGGDAWLTVALEGGDIEYEHTDRGWVAYFNDLHKGRNTGVVWAWFLDVFAIACIVFSLTGLFLLKMHAPQRGGTWPVVALGLLLPLLLAILFIH